MEVTLGTETLSFLEQMEQQLHTDLQAAEAKKLETQAKLADIQTAREALGRAVGQTVPFVAVVVPKTRTKHTSKPKMDQQWVDKLAGLNQPEAVVKIAQLFNRKLTVAKAAEIMVAAGKLQGKFVDSKSAAETRVAWLARKQGDKFKEIDSRTFELVAA